VSEFFVLPPRREACFTEATILKEIRMIAGRRSNSVRWTRRLVEGLRELGRTPVRFAFHLAIARLLTQWRSLLTIIAGTILSASIGALVPLYTTAVAQVGMLQRLEQQPARDVHVASSISLRAS